jgi:hypothetical protein
VEIPDGMPPEMAVGKFESLPLTSRDGNPLATLGDLGEMSDSVLTETTETRSFRWHIAP